MLSEVSKDRFTRFVVELSSELNTDCYRTNQSVIVFENFLFYATKLGNKVNYTVNESGTRIRTGQIMSNKSYNTSPYTIFQLVLYR